MRDSRYIPKEEFDAIYGRVPRLTVELIIKTPNGVLLTKRSMPPELGNWHFPGGTVYFGEPLPDAVKRVAKDELGVEVSIMRLIGYVEYPHTLAAGYKGWPVGIAFEVKIVNGEVRGSDQGEEIGYFTSVPTKIIQDQGKFLNTYVFTGNS